MENHAVAAVQEPGLLTPELTMVILTWVSFISLLIILHRYAWKPILKSLDEREKHIRGAVEYADKVKKELEEVQKSRDQILNEAYAKSKEIVDDSRKGATEAARVIEQKAKEEAHIFLKNARQEIQAEGERAQAHLRKEAVDLSIQLAAKLIQENLDSDKNRKIVNEYIKGL
jgi:F-type H+-transporting ATPase subunit b